MLQRRAGSTYTSSLLWESTSETQTVKGGSTCKEIPPPEALYFRKHILSSLATLTGLQVPTAAFRLVDPSVLPASSNVNCW